MNQKKIAVCMATYNGQNYIIEQLRSIYRQTREPDEVVICDDNSKDNTVLIIQEFIKEHHLEDKWHLYCNEVNKGYPKNFYYAMSLCQGDIVFLADQDDIWDAKKIEKMSQVILVDENIAVLSSAWRIMNRRGLVVGYGDNGNGEKLEKITISQILYKYRWPGMSMCYKREFGYEVLAKVQHTNLPHDMALALCAAERDRFVSMNTYLQNHRYHEDNVATEEYKVWKRLNKKRKVGEIQSYLELMDEILNNPAFEDLKDKERITFKYEIMQERLNNLKQGKVFHIIKQWWKNKDVVRVSTMFCDCLICGRKIDVEIKGVQK